MDTSIAIALGLVQLALGVWGLRVTFRAPHTRRQHRVAYGVFVALSAFGVGLVAWEASRASAGASAALKAQSGDPDRPPLVDVISLPGATRFVVSNGADYPAYAVEIQLLDTTGGTMATAVRTYTYQEISAHTGKIDTQADWTPPADDSVRHFEVLIRTRAGTAQEDLVLRPAGNGQWMRAVRVQTEHGRVSDMHADTAWPRDASGALVW